MYEMNINNSRIVYVDKTLVSTKYVVTDGKRCIYFLAACTKNLIYSHLIYWWNLARISIINAKSIALIYFVGLPLVCVPLLLPVSDHRHKIDYYVTFESAQS